MKTLIASILILAFASSALAAGKQQIHYAKPGKNAKKGDIIVLRGSDEQLSAIDYCDLTKNILVVGNTKHGNLMCSYIGYKRAEAK